MSLLRDVIAGERDDVGLEPVCSVNSPLVLFFLLVGPVLAAVGEGSSNRGLDPAVLIGVAVMLVVAKLGGEVFERVHQPGVLGELFAGILLGNLVVFGFAGAEPLKTNGT